MNSTIKKCVDCGRSIPDDFALAERCEWCDTIHRAINFGVHANQDGRAQAIARKLDNEGYKATVSAGRSGGYIVSATMVSALPRGKQELIYRAYGKTLTVKRNSSGRDYHTHLSSGAGASVSGTKRK